MVKIIRLDKPIAIFGKPVHEIRLKEPSGQHYIDFGEPRIAVVQPGGGGYWIEQHTAIKSYLEVCIDHEQGGALIAQMGLRDTMRLKEALFDFFREASEKHGGEPQGA